MGIACNDSYNKKKVNIDDIEKGNELKQSKASDITEVLKDKNKDIIENSKNISLNNNSNKNINESSIEYNESSEKDAEQPNPPNFQTLDSFIEKTEIQDTFYEKNIYNNDSPYSELKKFEKEEMIEQFHILSKKYEKDFLKKEKPKLDLDINLINNILVKEDTKIFYKNKIIKEIDNIKNDKENQNYKIEYLTILLVGRKKVGKTTLIQYMLKLKDDEIKNKNENEDFVIYKNNRITHLRLIEFKGMGYDENDSPEVIAKKAKEFIKKRNKSKNYNDFIHCIWYCISGTRLEKLELKVLYILKKSYQNSDIPIILVYTNVNVIDEGLTEKMRKYIISKNIEPNFVKILPKYLILANSNKRIDEFGEKDLLNLTLIKCTNALGGKMILLMVNKLSDDIKENMLKINNKNERDLNNNIIEEFIKKYNSLLDDESFIYYIINILGRKLTIFYDKSDISNSSLNYIIKSDIIKKISEYIKRYKEKTNEIIKTVVDSKAKKFIDYQATKEKNMGISIRLDNKRDFEGFKETNRNFLKQNFYYISQKDLINYIIRKYCVNYFFTYRKQLDGFIIQLLNKKNRDKDIDSLLIDCFSSKLKDFANKNNIPFEKKNCNIIKNALPKKNPNDEVLIKPFENQNENSIILYNNESDKDENKDKDEDQDENDKNDLWFPFSNKDLKYLNNNNIDSLKNFLNKIEFQENYFNSNTSDKPFNKLKEFMKKDLKKFFNLIKNPFIRNIEKQYNKKKLNGSKIPIKNILQYEEASSIYSNKIKNEFEKLKNDTTFVSIDYLTVIVVGKSGVGKSTLINGLLKLVGEKIAKTYVGRIGTKEERLYISKKVNFLRIIDTRGIEFAKKYGPTQILENTKKIINNQKLNIKIPCNEQIEKEDNEKKYNNYVSCIWYCVSNNGIDPQEFEILKGLKNGQDVLPIIVVYTNSLDSEKIKSVEMEIKNRFEDLPFISVLAKSVGNLQGIFGLEKLLNKTLELCKKAFKGDIFNTIKGIITSEIIKIFNKENKVIKSAVNNEIVSRFVNNYNKILDDNNFINYIYYLLEIVFIGYIKNNKEQKKLSSYSKDDLQNSSMISDYINSYIEFYKNNAKNFINDILSEKSLKYLDKQAKIEKYEFKQNISIQNKNNENDFNNIIETFLTDNFNFLTQKYIIYRLITDVRESFSEKVEKEINLIVEEILKQNDAHNWSKDIYDRKFDDLIKKVKDFENNVGYGDDNDSKKRKSQRSKFSYPNNSLNEVKEINYPEAPNPNLIFGKNNS